LRRQRAPRAVVLHEAITRCFDRKGLLDSGEKVARPLARASRGAPNLEA
jgi:hypothetical protein